MRSSRRTGHRPRGGRALAKSRLRRRPGRTCAAQTGGHGPRGAKCPGGDRRSWLDVAAAVRTLRKFWLRGLPPERLERLCSKLLANDAIEQVIVGPLNFQRLEFGTPYKFQLRHVALAALDDAGLMAIVARRAALSEPGRDAHDSGPFRSLGREPTDVELETVAQTWSEHCSHKTLAGRIRYRDERGSATSRTCSKRRYSPPRLKIRRQLAEHDWCVSVFQR